MGKLEFEHAVSVFNTKYGTYWDAAAFEARMSEAKNAGDKTRFCAQEIAKLAKQAIGGFVDYSTQDIDQALDPEAINADFASIINAVYNPWCEERKVDSILFDAHLSNNLSGDIVHIIKQVPANRIDFAASRYQDGSLRIRDMRAFAEKLQTKGKPTPEELSTVQVYKEALEQTNKSRSFVWKMFHPVRNAAEQKQAKNLANYINELTQRYPGEYNGVDALANDDSLIPTTAEALEHDLYTEAKEAIPALNKKERLSVVAAAEQNEKTEVKAQEKEQNLKKEEIKINP